MKWEFVSWKTLMLIPLSIVFSIFFYYLNKVSGTNIFIIFIYICYMIPPLLYFAHYIGILIDIIKKGSRAGWLTFWIICLILFPFSLIFTIIYLSVGRNVVTHKTLTERAKVNINLNSTKDIEHLDRSIKKQTIKFCSECGSKIKEGSKFCSECGSRQQ